MARLQCYRLSHCGSCPLEDLTDLLSGEKRVTCSATKPLLRKYFVDKEEDTTLTCQLKEKIRQDVESRYIQPNISAFLDVFISKGQFSPTEVVKVVKEEMELLVTEDQEGLDDDTDLSANCEPLPKRVQPDFWKITCWKYRGHFISIRES